MAFTIFGGNKIRRTVIRVTISTHDFVIAGISIVWIIKVPIRIAYTKIVACPGIFIIILRGITKRRVVKVDAGINNTNEDAFTLCTDLIRNSCAIPDFRRA